MTYQEAEKRLQELPEHMRTVDWLKSKLRYETHQGIHTYHECECGRSRTRSGWCPQCCREMLAVLESDRK